MQHRLLRFHTQLSGPLLSRVVDRTLKSKNVTNPIHFVPLRYLYCAVPAESCCGRRNQGPLLLRNKSCQRFSLRPRVGRNIAMRASPTTRNFLQIYLHGPFNFIFSKSYFSIFLALDVANASSRVGLRNKIGHLTLLFKALNARQYWNSFPCIFEPCSLFRTPFPNIGTSLSSLFMTLSALKRSGYDQRIKHPCEGNQPLTLQLQHESIPHNNTIPAFLFAIVDSVRCGSSKIGFKLNRQANITDLNMYIKRG